MPCPSIASLQLSRRSLQLRRRECSAFTITEKALLNAVGNKFKIRKKMQDMSTMRWSIIAQATIVRTLLITILSFGASIWDNPVDVYRRIDRAIFHCIWQGAPDKVKRAVVGLPQGRGGLGVTDLQALARALHVQWTFRAVGCDVPLTRTPTSYFSTRLTVFAQKPLLHSTPR